MQHKIFNLSLLFCLSFLTPVVAHNVKTNADVGITFHIEPDHSPRAGEESQAWFALTRQGGKLIPLSQCDCDLKVYLESKDRSNQNPILNPSLIPISPEQYQNIPGANLVFPQPGIYQLQLTGKPTQEGDFTPFQVSYPVTVKPSITASSKTNNQTPTPEINSIPESEAPQTALDRELNTTQSSRFSPLAIAAIIGGLGLAVISLFLLFK